MIASDDFLFDRSRSRSRSRSLSRRRRRRDHCHSQGHYYLTFLRVLLLAGATLVRTSSSSSIAGQDTLVGVVGKDFVILGADSAVSSSIALTTSNRDKIAVVIDPFPYFGTVRAKRQRRWRWRWRQQQAVAVACAGDVADAELLASVLEAHAAVREYEAGVGCDVDVVYDGRWSSSSSYLYSSSGGTGGLDAASIAHFARGEIASSLRSGGGHLRVCLLVAGMVRSGRRNNRYDQGVVVVDGDDNDDDGMEDTTNWKEGRRTERDDYGGAGGGMGGGKRGFGFGFSDRIRRQVEAATVAAGRANIGARSEVGSSLEAAAAALASSDQSRDKDETWCEKHTLGGTTTTTTTTPATTAIQFSTQSSSSSSSGNDKRGLGLKTKRGRKDALLQPRLFWLDEYGSIQDLSYGSHGYGSNFVLSILDRGYRPDMTRKEAVRLVQECFRQLRERYVVNSPRPPCIKCVGRDGCRLVRYDDDDDDDDDYDDDDDDDDDNNNNNYLDGINDVEKTCEDE